MFKIMKYGKGDSIFCRGVTNYRIGPVCLNTANHHKSPQITTNHHKSPHISMSDRGKSPQIVELDANHHKSKLLKTKNGAMPPKIRGHIFHQSVMPPNIRGHSITAKTVPRKFGGINFALKLCPRTCEMCK